MRHTKTADARQHEDAGTVHDDGAYDPWDIDVVFNCLLAVVLWIIWRRDSNGRSGPTPESCSRQPWVRSSVGLFHSRLLSTVVGVLGSAQGLGILPTSLFLNKPYDSALCLAFVSITLQDKRRLVTNHRRPGPKLWSID